MKKLFLSLFVILSSGAYAVSQYLATGTSTTPTVTAAQPAQTQVAENTATDANPTLPTTTPVTSAPETTKPTTTKTSPSTPAKLPTPTPTPAPAPAPKGQYADGTYTGAAVDAYYGTVQIQATIQGGKLAAVDFLQYPNDRTTSQRINGHAMPLLKSEAITAQSANVSGVSGATHTSGAFRQSLGDALAQAKNS